VPEGIVQAILAARSEGADKRNGNKEQRTL